MRICSPLKAFRKEAIWILTLDLVTLERLTILIKQGIISLGWAQITRANPHFQLTKSQPRLIIVVVNHSIILSKNKSSTMKKHLDCKNKWMTLLKIYQNSQFLKEKLRKNWRITRYPLETKLGMTEHMAVRGLECI